MMKVQVLGGHGGQMRGFATTSFLIDNNFLIDAGAVASALTIEEQLKIDNILITHSHLDHIKDLAFLCDNCFGQKKDPFEVFTHATVKKNIKTHLLNDLIWPDFTILPSKENPTMRINAIETEVEFLCGQYKVQAIKVRHPQDAVGYIVEKDNVSILFSGDTGPTDRIWEVAHKVKNLKAIFTEVSFPNKLQAVADISDHHSPQTILAEVKKMPKDIPIILTHLKPNFRHEIMQELYQSKEKRITVLDSDGEVFTF